MDFVSRKIASKSELGAFGRQYRDAATQEQSRLEYMLILVLAYLWNKNIDGIGDEEKAYCFQEILRPSIGKILDVSRKLDVHGEIFGGKRNRKFAEELNGYPKLRNEKFGHGYSFEDDAEKLYEALRKINDEISLNMPEAFGNDFELVNVLTLENVSYKGIVYKPNGDFSPWVIPVDALDLEVGGLYLKSASGYWKISPFVKIENVDEIYVYSYVDDKLACRALYNRLVKTERKYFDAPELIDEAVEIDEGRKRSLNGTVVNIYSNNYKKYIETSIVKKVLSFLKKNESTVFATLWGHGGVGKTASIQRVCEALLTDGARAFDYIIFVSAKDRQFNYYKGVIDVVNDAVDSFDSVVRFINKVAFESDSSNVDLIVNFQGKMLIILDDYETFPADEKESIVDFIKTLNVAHHKVVITTRSANHITGEEIEVLELNKDETLEFFESVLVNELGVDPGCYKRGISLEQFKNALHELTSGRPLFIFQSAFIYGESGSVDRLLEQDLKSNDAAIDFLYGRILDYLSVDARKIFGAMGMIVSDGDLSNVISKLKYILNMEKDDQKFDSAIAELVKLKIIKIVDQKFFRVYSSEIAQIMRESFKADGDAGAITSRLQVVGDDKRLDNDKALLLDADSARVSHKISDVVNKYRHIISRPVTPDEIRVRAIVNLAQYLIEDVSNYDDGIGVLNEFNIRYKSNAEFVRAYTKYLWRGDDESKRSAVEYVKRLLAADDFKDDAEKLELLCVLMSYEALLLISAREELKAKYTLREIGKEAYEAEYSEQSKEFVRVYNYPGLPLFEKIKKDELKDYDHSTKVRYLNGLSSFVEVCVRRQRFADVDEIFEYVFNNLKYNYHDIFKQKLERVNRYRKESARHYDDYIVPGSVGDRFAAAEAGKKKAIERLLAKGVGVTVDGRYIAGALSPQTALSRQLLDLVKNNEEK